MEQRSDIAIAEELLGNWEWRLNNLYWVTDEEGRKVKFRLRPQQKQFFDGMHHRNVILKARQLGFTTFMLIFMLDQCLFRPNTKCALIAHTLPDAKRLFREKLKYAYDNLDPAIRAAVPAKNDAAGELVFSNDSSIYVSASVRGGTLRYLHVSEFGKICRKTPEKAREIVTGGFPAASKGVITIESTAEGKGGQFFEYCQTAEALEKIGAELTRLDWKFFFFPWFNDPKYRLRERVSIPQRLIEYFQRLQDKYGIELDYEQMAWYTKEEQTLGEDMKREMPATPEEAFEQAIQGAYYASQFDKIYREGRICSVPHQPGAAVHTIWDLGVNDTNAIWFVQRAGREWHIIDYYENSGEGVDFYARVLAEKRDQLGYNYGTHIGPHDLKVREWGNHGKTRISSAAEQGVRFTQSVEVSRADGIESARNFLALCWFDESRCELGIQRLQNYRKKWDTVNGCWKNEPLHDINSNGADSFRYLSVSSGIIDNAYSVSPVDQNNIQKAPGAGIYA